MTPQKSSNLRGDANSSPLVPGTQAEEGPPHPFDHVVLRPGETLVLAFEQPLDEAAVTALRQALPLELKDRVLAVDGARLITGRQHDEILRKVSDWLHTR